MLQRIWAVVRYEFLMAIKRPSMLIIIIVFAAFFSLGVDIGDAAGEMSAAIWRSAGQLAFGINLFFPVVAGIISADRAVRDQTLNVREVLRATQLDNKSYVIGKYLGVAFAILSLQFALMLLLGLEQVLIFRLPLEVIWANLVASLAINAPSLLFVLAFSLACPMLMPLRVYQILFTGYWYWGNYLNPEAFPTIAQTILNAAGRYMQGLYFDGPFGLGSSQADAWLNIGVLLAMAGLALFGLWVVLQVRDGWWGKQA